ncbi:hypothetical protein YQE_10426, partial [Dendroctonus ponderosae]
MIFKHLQRSVSTVNYIPRTMSTRTNDKNNILVERLGEVTTIGTNRPDKRNCIDHETAEMLENAIADFEKDNDAHVGVLYGTGGNFCAGFDFDEIANLEDLQKSTTDQKAQFSILQSRKFLRKPMIAALSGYAVAGGLELALLCDLRVMEETAVVGLYARRFGVPLVDGGTVRLPAVVGLSRALDLILTGKSLNAKEAFEWGLVNRIVACGTSLGQALQLAVCLAKFPQECLSSDRDSAYNSAFSQVYADLIKYEKDNADNISLKSIVEGAKKFISGVGKHGKTYNLRERDYLDWEKEYNQTAKSKL